MALSRTSKVIIGVLVGMGLLIGAGVGFVAWALGGVPGGGETVEIVVEEGDSAASVAKELDAEGVIRVALAFRLKARSRDLDRNLKAGTYALKTGMSVDEALNVIEAGPRDPDSMAFTIPEGFTVEQIVSRLGESTPHDPAAYRDVLSRFAVDVPDWAPDLEEFGEQVREPYEGLLFPETYELRADASPQAALQRMADQLQSVFRDAEEAAGGATTDGAHDRYDILTIASLIEEEARIAEERPTIAGVIYNRLERDMPLQIDASNIYAVGEHTEDVGGRYLEIDSPYNLYENAGLPPTPIAAPGRASIEAALNPEQHDFLYYVKIDEEGHHAFAETLEEHNENKEKYRELRERQQTTSPSSTPPTSAPTP